MQWTMSMIRACDADADGKFFSRETMRFFGDKMSNFRIVGKAPQTDNMAPIEFRRVRGTGKIGPKSYIFNPETGRITGKGE